MTTHDQIIEGRDEALDHLGMNPTKWDALTDTEKVTRIRWITGFAPIIDAAALTIAEAEMSTMPGLKRVKWLGVVIHLRFAPARYRQTDYALQA